MIYIIGGKGFVGSAFVRASAAAGKEFLVIHRRNYAEFIGKSCNVLINANGNSKKFLAEHDPFQDFDASVRSVRASLIDFKYDLYVYISSCDVYPDCSSPRTTSEDQELNVSMQSTYGFHKYLAEQCVRHTARRWLIIRFGGFVGPGLKKNPIFDILSGGPLWLAPESELQFMHTDQAAKIILNLLERGVHNDILNLCGRGVVKLGEIMEHTGKHVPVHPGSSRVHYEANLDKISALTEVPDTRVTVFNFLSGELQPYTLPRSEGCSSRKRLM